MTGDPTKAYSGKQWFWAVNLVALMGTLAFVIPAMFSDAVLALVLAPYTLAVTLIISWIFVAPALAFAMRKPATWVRAGLWGAGTSAGIALVGFTIAQWRRNAAQDNPSYNYRLGGGDYVRDIDGVLTPYGWQVVVQNNAMFIALGIGIALIVRAILGPGRTPQ